MTGEVVDAARAERIGLVTEVVPHVRVVARAVELATQIAGAQEHDLGGLDARFRSVSERNKSQLAAEERP
jgi:enoyl-CoA hydratase